MSFILGLLCYLRKIALCFWIGQMLFFITIFAPRVFAILPRPMAADLQGSIFPAYYVAGLVCGVVILVSLVATQGFGIRSITSDARGLGGELFTNPSAGNRQLSNRRFRSLIGLALFALIVYGVSLWWITPELNSLRPLIYAPTPDVAAQEHFRSLHQMSVQANGAALLALLILLFLV
ncbi:MAG: DUF4149 domain-containing protein [Bdellovibrionota bacterium]